MNILSYMRHIDDINITAKKMINQQSETVSSIDEDDMIIMQEIANKI